jgi:hypothetical protein
MVLVNVFHAQRNQFGQSFSPIGFQDQSRGINASSFTMHQMQMQQLNVVADEKAKPHLQQSAGGQDFQPPQLSADLSPWSVWTDGRTLVKDLKPELREHCSSQ